MTTIPFTTDQSTWVGIDIAKKHNDVLIGRPRRRRQHFKVANQLEDYRPCIVPSLTAGFPSQTVRQPMRSPPQAFDRRIPRALTEESLGEGVLLVESPYPAQVVMLTPSAFLAMSNKRHSVKLP
jgi:hypothetical protein